jgi:acyl carrier protein
MLTSTEIRSIVLEEIEGLLLEEGDEPVALSGRESMAELALNSLSLARLVIQLEAAVGVDPFTDGSGAISDLRSVGDLVAAYQDAVDERGNDRDRAAV